MRRFLTYITQLNLPTTIILLVGCVGLWIPDLTNAIGQEPIPYQWMSFPIEYTFITSPLTLTITTLAIAIVNSLILTAILYNSGETKERTAMPVITFMLLMGSMRSLHQLPSAQLGLTFFLTAFFLIYSVYRQTGATKEVFEATLFILIASIFTNDYIWFVLFILIALIVNRIVSGRTLSAMLIAIITFCLYAAIWIIISQSDWQDIHFNRLIDRGIYAFNDIRAASILAGLFVAEILLIIHYYLGRALLNIQPMVVFDLLIVATIFSAILIILPAAIPNIFPILLLSIAAFATHLFTEKPSLLQGVSFVVFIVGSLAIYFM